MANPLELGWSGMLWQPQDFDVESADGTKKMHWRDISKHLSLICIPYEPTIMPGPAPGKCWCPFCPECRWTIGSQEKRSRTRVSSSWTRLDAPAGLKALVNGKRKQNSNLLDYLDRA